jgi:membrane protein
MSEDMDFEKKDDIDTKEILDNINSNVQVKKSRLPIILLALLYGMALYGFIFSFIANIILLGLLMAFAVTLFITFFVVMVLQVRGIESAKKIGDINYCLNTYFLYKYITAPFICGCVGILSYIIFEWISMTIKSDNQLVTSILIFLFIVFIVVVVPYILASYVFIGLPCTVAVNCMLDITRKKYGMSFSMRTIHFFLQMIPIVNIIDVLYISIKYWKKGMGLAILTVVYSYITMAILALTYWVIKSLGR